MRFGVDDTKYIKHILEALLNLDSSNGTNIGSKVRISICQDLKKVNKILEENPNEV